MKIQATANPNGVISIYVETSEGKIHWADLNHILSSELYRAGYEKTEDNRLKNMDRIFYKFK